MFDHTSRYRPLETATLTLPNGRTVAYVRRRFLPAPETLPTLQEVPVLQGERPDQLAARTLGDPTAYWRLCDANNESDPAELTSQAGRYIRVPVPTPIA